MMAMAAPARRTAHGLRGPMRSLTCAGRPKMPLPRMELTVRATRLQRPMARTRPSLEEGSNADGGTASLYHISGVVPNLRSPATQRGDFGAEDECTKVRVREHNPIGKGREAEGSEVPTARKAASIKASE